MLQGRPRRHGSCKEGAGMEERAVYRPAEASRGRTEGNFLFKEAANFP